MCAFADYRTGEVKIPLAKLSFLLGYGKTYLSDNRASPLRSLEVKGYLSTTQRLWGRGESTVRVLNLRRILQDGFLEGRKSYIPKRRLRRVPEDQEPLPLAEQSDGTEQQTAAVAAASVRQTQANYVGDPKVISSENPNRSGSELWVLPLDQVDQAQNCQSNPRDDHDLRHASSATKHGRLPPPQEIDDSVTIFIRLWDELVDSRGGRRLEGSTVPADAESRQWPRKPLRNSPNTQCFRRAPSDVPPIGPGLVHHIMSILLEHGGCTCGWRPGDPTLPRGWDRPWSHAADGLFSEWEALQEALGCPPWDALDVRPRLRLRDLASAIGRREVQRCLDDLLQRLSAPASIETVISALERCQLPGEKVP